MPNTRPTGASIAPINPLLPLRPENSPLARTLQRMSTSVPPMMSVAPSVALSVSVSPRKTTDSTMANATLSLSTGATCDTLPSCSARK